VKSEPPRPSRESIVQLLFSRNSTLGNLESLVCPAPDGTRKVIAPVGLWDSFHEASGQAAFFLRLMQGLSIALRCQEALTFEPLVKESRPSLFFGNIGG
jgi:hypothetical protein